MTESKTTDRSGDVGEGGAIFAFGAWLTARHEEAGPFSRHHDAGQMARLCGEFCEMQGWDVDDSRFPDNLRRPCTEMQPTD